MTFLPIVARELRVGARRRSAFWARLVAASTAILFGGSALWLAEDWQSTATLGSSMFNTLAFLAFLFSLAAGPIFTADVISEEKRESTLGLLFLTDLKGYDVVLGKLVAASVTSFFGLLAALPVLALALLLGGTSLIEFARVALSLANTLWFSLTVGILVSTCSHHARSAFAVSGFVLFLFASVAPWLEYLWRQAHGVGLVNACLLTLSPGHTLTLARSLGPRPPGLEFWAALATIHALAWVFLGLASWIVERVWRERVWRTQPSPWLERWRRWCYGTPAERRALRTSLLHRNPVLWLSSRNLMKRRILWSAWGLALTTWLLGCLFGGMDWQDWGITAVIALFLQVPLKWLMAAEATHRWVEDRQLAALELLLTTPLTVPEMLAGQLQALRRLFFVPVAALFLVEAVALNLGFGKLSAGPESAHLALAGLAFFLWDLHALAWVGMWQGLLKRRATRAFLATTLRVLIVPWLVFAVFVLFIGIPPSSDSSASLFLVTLWSLVCGGANLIFYVSTRKKLRRQFRAVAAGDVHAPPTPTPLPAPA